MNQNRLFVGNLSYQTMENDLQDYLSQAGVVTSVNLMLDKATGKSRGFAFVEFTTAEEANKAVEQFHGKEFQGRTLTVNIARPREERAPRWSGDRARRRSAGLNHSRCLRLLGRAGFAAARSVRGGREGHGAGGHGSAGAGPRGRMAPFAAGETPAVAREQFHGAQGAGLICNKSLTPATGNPSLKRNTIYG